MQSERGYRYNFIVSLPKIQEFRLMKRLLTIALFATTMTLLSCDKTVKQPSENPLTAEWNTPYGIPPFDLIQNEHYAPALKYAMA